MLQYCFLYLCEFSNEKCQLSVCFTALEVQHSILEQGFKERLFFFGSGGVRPIDAQDLLLVSQRSLLEELICELEGSYVA